jgi:hypothetical protein
VDLLPIAERPPCACSGPLLRLPGMIIIIQAGAGRAGQGMPEPRLQVHLRELRRALCVGRGPCRGPRQEEATRQLAPGAPVQQRPGALRAAAPPTLNPAHQFSLSRAQAHYRGQSH